MLSCMLLANAHTDRRCSPARCASALTPPYPARRRPVGLAVLSGNLRWLASKIVQLEGAPVRSLDERVALLERLLQPVVDGGCGCKA